MPVLNGAAPIQQPVALPLPGQAAISAPTLLGVLPSPASEPIGTPSECLLLKNLFDPTTEVCLALSSLLVNNYSFVPQFSFYLDIDLPNLLQTDPEFDLDIKEDVEEECSKFGRVRHIYVDKYVLLLTFFKAVYGCQITY